MSYWTHISGTITLHIHGHTDAHNRYILETVLDHLPKVTGSEGNMRVYIVKPHGHNASSSHNEFDECMGYREDADCDGWMKIQEKYILVLEGNLRDRFFEETKRELSKWLCRLAKRLWVTDILVRLEGYDQELLITDSTPYGEMSEPFSWNEESGGEPAWIEYLFWDKAKNYNYPMLLAYKYFSDPENDAEVKRRLKYHHEIIDEEV